MEINEEDYLAHYGTPRHSGRYPWGSGGNEAKQTRNQSLLDSIQSMKDDGLDEKTIAAGLGMSIKELRAAKSNAKAELKAAAISQMTRLRDKGVSTTEIAKRMGFPEPTVRSYLAPGAKDKLDKTQTVSRLLKDEVDKKEIIDIGAGVANRIGVSQTRFDNAVALLKDKGYKVWNIPQPQVLSGHDTKQKVLTSGKFKTQRDAFLRRDDVKQIGTFVHEDGITTYGLEPAMIINPKRVGVVYGEEGKKADGVIYVRPGVEDVSLGGKLYAQVRIRVGDKHYLKGMAVYKDDLPDGVDLQFNTPKKDTGDKLDAFKPLDLVDGKVDDKNPFNAYIAKQIGPETVGHVTSAMNIVNEEGRWAEWSRTLSSQFLSKQKPRLAKQQLDMTLERREQDFDALMKLTNPTVRKKMLEDFAANTDTAAVHLKAAQLPRQAVHVILPINSMKPNEAYAPNFDNGDTVVLIRHPHGGPFEIPRLVVNNKNPDAIAALGHDATDAIGIHSSVADQLSGADFDGDTVLVIPDNNGRIKSSPMLEGLKDFDPVAAYPGHPEMRVMRNTQAQMGEISNLITDMSLKGASPEKLARAVRHSMVVIDAENKKLNYRESAKVNGIAALKAEYQKDPVTGRGGAATLISRKKSDVPVDEIRPRRQRDGGPVDKATGALVFEPTGRTRINKEGVRVPRRTIRPALATVDDAHDLSSGTPMEELYADHSNKLKALANKARLAALNTPPAKQVDSARKTYANEVASLEASLDLANRNRPLERQAHIIARANIKLKTQGKPKLEKDDYNKIARQALTEARARIGASSHRIKISDREWDAIQAGAISNHKLQQILTYADEDQVRDHATPKSALLMTPTKTRRAQSMKDLGYTENQIAHQLGVSLTTLRTALKG